MSLELDKIVHKPHPEYGDTLYPVLVYRPNDLYKASKIMKRVSKMSKKNKLTEDKFQELLSVLQYTLVGLLGKDSKIYNNYGEVVGEPHKLDRFSLSPEWQDIMYSGFPKV